MGFGKQAGTESCGPPNCCDGSQKKKQALESCGPPNCCCEGSQKKKQALESCGPPNCCEGSQKCIATKMLVVKLLPEPRASAHHCQLVQPVQLQPHVQKVRIFVFPVVVPIAPAASTDPCVAPAAPSAVPGARTSALLPPDGLLALHSVRMHVLDSPVPGEAHPAAPSSCGKSP